MVLVPPRHVDPIRHRRVQPTLFPAESKARKHGVRGLTFEVTRDRRRSARAARQMICLGCLAALARSWWASR